MFSVLVIRLRSLRLLRDRKSGSAGMPRPTSYAVSCLKKKNQSRPPALHSRRGRDHRRGRGARPAVLRPGHLRSLGDGDDFFFNDTPTTEIYTLSLHDALPIYRMLNRGLLMLSISPLSLQLLIG